MINGIINHRQRRNRLGFSLVEIAIVLGVVVLGVGGIWSAAASVQEKFRVNQAASGLIITTDNVRRIFHSNWPTSYLKLSGGGNDNLANDMGIFNGASGFVFNNADNKVYDPWGNNNFWIEILPVAAGVFPGRSIQFSFNNVPVNRCINLVSAVTSRFRDNTDLMSVTIQEGSTYNRYTTIPFMPNKAECIPAETGWIIFEFAMQ